MIWGDGVSAEFGELQCLVGGCNVDDSWKMPVSSIEYRVLHASALNKSMRIIAACCCALSDLLELLYVLY